MYTLNNKTKKKKKLASLLMVAEQNVAAGGHLGTSTKNAGPPVIAHVTGDGNYKAGPFSQALRNGRTARSRLGLSLHWRKRERGCIVLGERSFIVKRPCGEGDGEGPTMRRDNS